MCGRAFRFPPWLRRHAQPIVRLSSAPKAVAEKRMHVLVTGAGGFIGEAAVSELVRRGHRVRALSTRDGHFGPAVECIPVPRWRGASLPIDARVLAGVDVVVH